MSQNHVVMAFRKRLRKRGYVDVSIYWQPTVKKYRVNAIEPLAKYRVSALYDLYELNDAFRF